METVGVGLRRETKQLGAKEKARRNNCDVRFSFAQKNRVFQNLLRVGARKLLVMGSEASSGHCPYRMVG